MSKIAIIGTAGRDRSMPMTKSLWEAMTADARNRTSQGCHLVSGGAAWADHLAVELFLTGHASDLTLHLPAPFENGRFVGPYKGAASAANYYHRLFSEILNYDTLGDIAGIEHHPRVHSTFQPEAAGYAAMFARNKLVAADATEMLAYTWGTGNKPADGGTLNTWNQCGSGRKTHIPLHSLS
jgi:hypothetical protein